MFMLNCKLNLLYSIDLLQNYSKVLWCTYVKKYLRVPINFYFYEYFSDVLQFMNQTYAH